MRYLVVIAVLSLHNHNVYLLILLQSTMIIQTMALIFIFS